MAETSQKNYKVSPEALIRMRRRYPLAAGVWLGERELSGGVASSFKNIHGDEVTARTSDEREQLIDEFSMWMRCLYVGPPVRDDYGTTHHPPAELQPGVRVLTARAVPENLELEVDGVMLTVGRASWRSPLVFDRGVEAETDSSLDVAP